MVYIVGLGPGNRDYILKKAIDILNKSDVIIGFERLIKNLDFVYKEKIVMKSLKETLDYINKYSLNNELSKEEKNIALVEIGRAHV